MLSIENILYNKVAELDWNIKDINIHLWSRKGLCMSNEKNVCVCHLQPIVLHFSSHPHRCVHEDSPSSLSYSPHSTPLGLLFVLLDHTSAQLTIAG
jgi:hypothetical protein